MVYVILYIYFRGIQKGIIGCHNIGIREDFPIVSVINWSYGTYWKLKDNYIMNKT